MPAAFLNEEGNTVKVCSTCGVLKDVDAFHNSKASKDDGKHYYCKECVKAKGAAYRATPEAKAKKDSWETAYRATPEAKAKAAARNATYRAKPENKAKIAASNAAYYAKPEIKAERAAYAAAVNATPEGKAKKAKYAAAVNATPEGKAKQAARRAAYFLTAEGTQKGRESCSKRRAKIANNGIWVVSKKDLNKIYSSPCLACGSHDNITLGHIIPIARGGGHKVGNFVSQCFTCNVSQGSMLWTEWKYSSRPRAVEVFAA